MFMNNNYFVQCVEVIDMERKISISKIDVNGIKSKSSTRLTPDYELEVDELDD